MEEIKVMLMMHNETYTVNTQTAGCPPLLPSCLCDHSYKRNHAVLVENLSSKIYLKKTHFRIKLRALTFLLHQEMPLQTDCI